MIRCNLNPLVRIIFLMASRANIHVISLLQIKID